MYLLTATRAKYGVAFGCDHHMQMYCLLRVNAVRVYSCTILCMRRCGGLRLYHAEIVLIMLTVFIHRAQIAP